MRLLLDTHIFIGVCEDDGRLRWVERQAMASSNVLVSAATAWEIAIKHAAGQLKFPVDRFHQILLGFEFSPLEITQALGLEMGALPRHHKDPFDRVLAAQSRLEDLVPVTHDPQIRAYDVRVLDQIM